MYPVTLLCRIIQVTIASVLVKGKGVTSTFIYKDPKRTDLESFRIKNEETYDTRKKQIKLTTLPLSMSRLYNVGSSTSHNPICLPGLLRG
jgi:hypothetical protein